MKKISILLISLFLISFHSLSAEEKPLNFEIGIATGFPFYGSKTLVNDMTDIEDGSRFVIGGTADMNLNLLPTFSLFTGADLLSDFKWNSQVHSNHLDYALYFGAKIYPFAKGFNFSLAYALGSRTDFMTTPLSKDEVKAFWGNGVRMSLEYNFSHGNSYKNLPAIGTYWRSMPRGKKLRDNILAFYLKMVF